MARANAGKYLEDAVEKFFNELNRIDVAIDRLPDTRSARNMIKAQNADFMVSSAVTGALYLECKSIGGSKRILRMFRQYPLMLRWARAGVPGFVLAHYYDIGLMRVYNTQLLSTIPLTGKQWNDPLPAVIFEVDRKEAYDEKALRATLHFLIGGQL